MKHIRASICLLTDVPRPKTAGVISGYAPTHHFEKFPELVSGFHNYGDKEFHYPGEMLTADVAFPSWEFIKGLITVGDKFTISEGERLVGRGTVLHVYGSAGG